MPLYTWVCERCGAEMDILRLFDGYQDPPTAAEEPAGCEHTWTKIIHSPSVTKGPSWGGGKGNW